MSEERNSARHRAVEPTDVAPCIMDFPAAWAFTIASKDEAHDPRCSWIQARMLCDCHVIWDEYGRRKRAEQAEAALARVRAALDEIAKVAITYQPAAKRIERIIEIYKRAALEG